MARMLLKALVLSSCLGMIHCDNDTCTQLCEVVQTTRWSGCTDGHRFRLRLICCKSLSKEICEEKCNTTLTAAKGITVTEPCGVTSVNVCVVTIGFWRNHMKTNTILVATTVQNTTMPTVTTTLTGETTQIPVATTRISSLPVSTSHFARTQRISWSRKYKTVNTLSTFSLTSAETTPLSAVTPNTTLPSRTNSSISSQATLFSPSASVTRKTNLTSHTTSTINSNSTFSSPSTSATTKTPSPSHTNSTVNNHSTSFSSSTSVTPETDISSHKTSIDITPSRPSSPSLSVTPHVSTPSKIYSSASQRIPLSTFTSGSRTMRPEPTLRTSVTQGRTRGKLSLEMSARNDTTQAASSVHITGANSTERRIVSSTTKTNNSLGGQSPTPVYNITKSNINKSKQHQEKDEDSKTTAIAVSAAIGGVVVIGLIIAAILIKRKMAKMHQIGTDQSSDS